MCRLYSLVCSLLHNYLLHLCSFNMNTLGCVIPLHSFYFLLSLFAVTRAFFFFFCLLFFLLVLSFSCTLICSTFVFLFIHFCFSLTLSFFLYFYCLSHDCFSSNASSLSCFLFCFLYLRLLSFAINNAIFSMSPNFSTFPVQYFRSQWIPSCWPSFLLLGIFTVHPCSQNDAS